MTDLLPFLRLYRQHWLSLSIGLLLALLPEICRLQKQVAVQPE